MAHKHPVHDTDAHFKINPITRAITTTDQLKTIMQGDHNSERFSFEIPNVIDGHDMKLCNRVRIHFINGDHKDIYEVNDIVDLDDKTLVFTWLISGNATQFAGGLNFLIEFTCLSDENEIDYSLHTNIFSQQSITAGMNNAEAVLLDYPDILEQWKEEVLSDITVDPEQIETEVLDVLTETELVEVIGADDETAYTDEEGNVIVDVPEIPECKVKTVNGIEPDEEGNIQIDIPEIPECKVKTVNNIEPDEEGNVQIDIPKAGMVVDLTHITIEGDVATVSDVSYTPIKTHFENGGNVVFKTINEDDVELYINVLYMGLAEGLGCGFVTINAFNSESALLPWIFETP